VPATRLPGEGPPGRDEDHEFDPHDRATIPSHAKSAEAGGDLVLLHLERGTYYTLNPTGAWIWRLAGEGRSLGDICSALVARFAVDEDRAWRDLRAILHDLVREDLVVIEAAHQRADGR